MGQSAHPGRTRAVRRRALLAGLLVAGSGLATGCAGSVAHAATVLRGALQATVVHADGSSVPGADGLTLRPGDVVRTGRAGRAELETRSRRVYVGSQASVQVLDGAHQQLRHGAVVVDAQHGPGLRLDVATLDVTVGDGSAVRAERSVMVRVGALAGRSHVVSSTGRTLSVPPLRQVVVGGDALPDATAPLRLTDDDGEARAVPALVRDDEALIALARGIDGDGAATAHVVTAAWKDTLDPVPGRIARSERVLPVVIAAAGPRSDAVARYHSAVALRSAGGSWGVVAHLLGVAAPRVVDALASLQRTQPPGRIGDVRAIFAAGGLGSSGGRSASGGTNGSGGGTGGSGSGGSGSGGGGGAGGTPTPTPTPGGAGGVVDDTVATVLSLVPTPTPTPSGLLPTGDLTSPLPLPSVP